MRAKGILITLVLLAVLVVVAVVVDGIVREQTEDRLATELQAELGGLPEPPDVTIDGFPFLTQVLVGRLREVRVSTPEAVVEDVALQDVHVRLEGVSTDQPTTAEQAYFEAFLPIAEIQDLIPVDADFVVEGDTIVGSTSFFGVGFEVVLRPEAAGRAVAVGIDSLRVAGSEVSVEDLPGGIAGQIQGLTVPLEQLPEGVELTDLVVQEDGVHVTAEGTDVVIEAVEAS